MEIKKVLLATDLSPASRQAYGHAAAIAKQFGAQVLFMHVNEAAGFGFHTSRELVNYLSAVGERIRVQMDEEIKLLDDIGLEVKVLMAAGTPSREILRTAENEQVDMVIVTRRGKELPVLLHQRLPTLDASYSPIYASPLQPRISYHLAILLV